MAGSNMNGSLSGFRFVSDGNRVDPVIRIMDVATAYGTAIYRGDVLKQLNNGTVAVASPGDTSLIGIADGAEFYYDSATSALRKGNHVPASISFTGNDNRTRVRVIIASADTIFEAACDDNSTATTFSAYQAFLGENCDFASGTGNSTSGQSGQAIDISTHGATDGNFRLIEIPDASFQDFSAAYVRLRVKFNESHLFTVAGI